MKAIFRIAVVAAFLLSPFAGPLMAQPGPGGGGQPPCWPPPCIPIDGGISLLIGAGALLGGRQLLEARKRDKQVA